METKVAFNTRRLASLVFMLGAFSVILSLVLAISPIRTIAAGEANSHPNQSSPGNCGTGTGVKVELKDKDTGYTFVSDFVITSVLIKAGSAVQGEACFTFTSDGTDGCYAVSGLGSTKVTVTEVGVGGGPGCKDISFIEFHSSPPTKTPTSTVTETVQPPVNTQTSTPTGTATDTVQPPGDTQTPTPTGTATETVQPPDDTQTPTPTGTATEILPPDPDTPTPTPTGTGTDVVRPPGDTQTPTPTGTGPGILPPDPDTPTPTPTVTGTDVVLPPVDTQTPTPTGTVTGVLPPSINTPTPTPTATDLVKPPLQTEVPATLPPPSAPEPRFKQPELVPVTGANRMIVVTPENTIPQELFLNMGLGLLGVSLVLFGISRKLQ